MGPGSLVTLPPFALMSSTVFATSSTVIPKWPNPAPISYLSTP
uniref:Uncharacterized protein n=1 Tax=Arundo donax TaxID=35708 RepID=A0A0A8XZR8_ARUDO